MKPILKAKAVSDRSWLVTMKGLDEHGDTTAPMIISVVIYLSYHLTPAEWFIDEEATAKCFSENGISFSPIALLGFWPVGLG